jgi:hypothetical protein
MVIDEASIALISDNTRHLLERIDIGGISEWEPVFSNGYGLGDGNTLVIDMRPANGSEVDVSDDAANCPELIDALDEGIHKSGFGVSFIDISTTTSDKGFLVIVRLKNT